MTSGPSREELLRQLEVSRRWARRWKATAGQLKRRLRAQQEADPAGTMEAIQDALEALDHITGDVETTDLVPMTPLPVEADPPPQSVSSD